MWLTARLHQPITSVSSVSVARVVDTRTDRTAGRQWINLHPQREDRGPNGRLARFVAYCSRAVISISQSWKAYFSVTKDNITNVSCCSFWKCSNVNHLFFLFIYRLIPSFHGSRIRQECPDTERADLLSLPAPHPLTVMEHLQPDGPLIAYYTNIILV